MSINTNEDETRLELFYENPASFIDHTILKSSATLDDIIQLCEEAKKYKFKSVCVNPCWVKKCTDLLKGTKVLVCTVIGFPLGANCSSVKVFESKVAVEDGAKEIDMVMNLGEYLSEPENFENKIKSEIEMISETLLKFSITLKVIIETSQLNQTQIQNVSFILGQIKSVNFVKTSTGFIGLGAQVEDVRIIRDNLPKDKGVKASGGIKTFEDVLKMVKAGANRIGTSSGVKIMEEWLALK
ncbi:hypothetical protein CROQUDRAFT_48657 [Cronartium quercuum f. sp. fusiforme G11]|uniref:deoxyribose-phosphate aldolase n=1 Tax=Cronartium quercuum f. sp. fusiforme G11 TaxID=708437 RepID=A0A9P6NG80_9BASI|nr:hypothetical protein CROQUDRAFT_48657 [Cronartium quercuum f. sp. fusiforme G11]